MSDRPGYMPFPFESTLRDMAGKLTQLIRGGLTLHDNLSRSHVVSYTHTAGAGTAQTVSLTSLGLSWTPVYFTLADIDTNATVYATTADKSSWSASQIVLRCSANNVAIKVVVW